MSSVDPEQWTRIQELFHQSRTDPGVLDRLSGSDRALRVELEELLSANVEAERAAVRPQRRPPSLAGRGIGNYRIDSLLGTGGMGSVYLAHRSDGQFERQVALKILSGHLRDEFFTSRFATERQLLASLDHPNITRLLDSGISDNGDPYLVLEYVEGVQVDQFCDARALPLAERISLFRQICEAVEFAHSRRVIHRDLKPSNLLVTPTGAVKLLDFGTAKLLESDFPNTSTTRFHMMTPRYASPEQLRGEAVTPASDVYSLGVVLYELLLGASPFGSSTSLMAGLERAVRAVEPAKPQSVVTEEAATCRGTSKPTLVQSAGGELWKVLCKALRPDPKDRYDSVRALAEDLGLFLKGARVNATSSRTLSSTAMLAMLAVLVTGLTAAGLTLWRRAHPAHPTPATLAVLPLRNISPAQSPLYLTDGLTDEIANTLADASPLVMIARSSAFSFRDRKQTAPQVGAELHATHLLEGSVTRADGRIKLELRLERTKDGATIWAESYDRPMDEVSALSSTVAAEVAKKLGASLKSRGGRASSRNREALESLQAARFEADQFTPEAFTKAEAGARRALALDPGYASAYSLLGAITINRSANTVRDLEGHRKVVAEGEAYYRQALELDPDLIAPRVNLAGLRLQNDWDWAYAESEYRRALAMGPNPTADTMYGMMLIYQGRFREADEHFALAQERNGYATSQVINLATARILERRYAEAESITQTVLDRSPTASAKSTRGWILVAEGKPERALEEYAKDPDSSPFGKMRRAQALAAAGRNKEALALLEPMEHDYRFVMPATSFAAAYAAMHDSAKAMEWLARGANDRDFAILYLGVAPDFDPLRGQPEFQALLKKVGLAK